MKYTDLIASGSNNGVVKLWKVTNENRLEHIKDISIVWLFSMKSFRHYLCFFSIYIHYVDGLGECVTVYI